MDAHSSLGTNLSGRLRNTDLSYNNGLMPLFEAVVNSIHSIEEAGLSTSDGRIDVEICRSTQQSLDLKNKRGPDAADEIIGFKITDNGIGFNDENMKSFLTLDSEHKAKKGCRGVGRLLWLKAFDYVDIDSVFIGANAEALHRKFRFNKQSGVTESPIEACTLKRETTVHLAGFGDSYKKATRKTTQAIATLLFEHCLWYYVRKGGAPHIQIFDPENDISLQQICDEHLMISSESTEFVVREHKFDMTHVKLSAGTSQKHSVSYCAASRLVKEEGLTGKIPGLFGKIKDGDSEFYYAGFIVADYLDAMVRSERTEFNIPETIENPLPDELSFKEIRDAVIQNATTFLKEHLQGNVKSGHERLTSFVSEKAPHYSPILKYLDEDARIIDPTISDKDLELKLHKVQADVEEKMLEQGHDLMTPTNVESPDDYQMRIEKYLGQVSDIKQADLAKYVSHRRVVIDLLEVALRRQADGKYVKEEVIHELIMPMGKEFSDISPLSNNLWLIDERLAFHNYLASDKSLKSMRITGAQETIEPDIVALNVFNTPMLVNDENRSPQGSLVVIEIKRPMRNDAKYGDEDDPIQQCLNYLVKMREGGMTTEDGRPILNANSMPGFCYVICDLTEKMKKVCVGHDLTVTSDGAGYFGYHRHYQAYIEVISFGRLTDMARQRNQAFFTKLGLPTK